MRRVCELALLTSILACTDGGPDPESFELVELELGVEVHAGFEHVPDRARVIDPATQPRLELVHREVSRELGLCAYEVEARGFPAITDDGATVVDVYGFVPGNADEVDARMELTWLDQEATLVDDIYDRSADIGSGCDQAIQGAHGRVAAINARLARHTWRPLERLDAFFSAPGNDELGFRFTGEEDEALARLAGPERPIEVFYRNAHFTARVRGLKVLQTTPLPDWRNLTDEFCTRDPQIQAIELDRASKVALVHYDYMSGGCLCDDRRYVARLELSEALLGEVDRRSTSRFNAIHAALMAGELDE